MKRRHGYAGPIAAMAAAALLSACAFIEHREAPLQGDRLPVMLHENSLTPDAALANVAVAVAPPARIESWPQLGGNSTHTSYHLALGANPRQAWRTSAGDGADKEMRILAQPVMDADGRVFVLDVEARVTAIDGASGRRLWSRPLRGDEEGDTTLGGGLAVVDGRVYVTTGLAQIVALEAASGKILWRQGTSAPFRSAPTVAEGRVFAVSSDNQTHALDAVSGNILWTHRGASELASLLGGASPAYDSGIVVIAYSTGELFGLRAASGTELWSDYLSRAGRTSAAAQISDIRASPVIDRGRVLAVSNSGRMVAINVLTGSRLWEQQIASIQTPWAAGDFIYLVTTDGVLVCLSRADGRIRWSRSVPRWENPKKQEDPITWAGPVLAGDRLLLAGSNRDLLAVSPFTGNLLGKLRMPDPVSVAPIVARDTIYVFTDGAQLVALR
ncbi:MAG: outer membrane protein assembly factor BamB [Pseudomonadota bacterium]|jgi:outer membrane protein assembly factor BamB